MQKIVGKLLLVLLLMGKTSLGQSIEQKAFSFLAENIYGQTLRNSNEQFVLTKDSTQIWYYPHVVESKIKLKLKNGVVSSEDHFYKIVHSDKDIFVRTKKASTENGVMIVLFDITTRYGVHHQYKVKFEKNVPYQLIRVSN
jgi:hypothetical protein